MNNISKNIVNEDGTEEIIIANSSDNYQLNLDKKYVLVGRKEKKESKLVKKFKNSLIGADIGVKSSGFSSVAILATVVALSVVIVIYFIWRF